MQRQIKFKSEMGVLLSATMYGETRDTVVRISCNVSDPSDALDNYAPPADLGYIWFRDVHEWPMVTGSFDIAIASTADSAQRILYSLLEQLVETDEQVHCRIALVDTRNTLVQTGELDLFVASSQGFADCRRNRTDATMRRRDTPP